MTIGFLQIDLLLRNTHSIKDKRSVISRIKNQVRAKFNVAVAEIEPNDRYGRCLLGITTISDEHAVVHQALAGCEKLIESFPEVQIAGSRMEML
jgi:uncharacterized protein YlxP (DUF503 family)